MISFKQFIAESGQAIKGLSRINQENVKPTMDDIYKRLLPVLGVKKADTELLGSTGKKKPGGSSGDVDLAIGIDAALKASGKDKWHDLMDHLMTKLRKVSDGIKDSRGLGIITIQWPIQGEGQKGEFVQLDLMFVDSLKFSSWTYFSPHEEESGYKGIYRTKALMIMAKYVNMDIIEKQIEGDEELRTVWKQNAINMAKGLYRITKDRRGKKGLLKTAKTVHSEFMSREPEEIVKMLFGPSFTLADTHSLEHIWAAIKSPKFAHKKNRKKILEAITNALTQDGVPLPENLNK